MGIKIVLEDGFSIQKGTGIGQHTLNLFHQLEKFPEIDSIQLMEKPFLSKIPSAFLRRALYIAWLNSYLQFLLRRRKADIVHFTNYLVPALRLSKVKYVVTIHDLNAWRFPETLPRTYISYIKWATTHAAKTADLICTISNAVKREILELLDIDSERIYTVYNGVAQALWETPRKGTDEAVAIKEKFGIKSDFLLFVGTLEERKNVMTLVKAFEALRNCKELQLVLVGRPGYGFPKLSRYIDKHRLKGQVILTGYVSEKEKIALYDLAAAFVYPSLYEGFGIPLVEAMVRKVPIVASRIPSTEEVVGDAAVYYGNDPFDHEALAEQILKVLENSALRQELVERGLKRAKEFSWKKVGQRCVQAYRKVLEGAT